MRRRADYLWGRKLLIFGALLFFSGHLRGQEQNEQGHVIGKVSTDGDLIVIELDAGVLGNANLFNLTGRTLHFKPEGSRYRVQNESLQWDSDFGAEIVGADVSIPFAFPFSGGSWKALTVGATGSIRFGKTAKQIGLDAYGKSDGGVSLDRFDELADAAATVAGNAPAICAFLKPRMSGQRYVKTLPDRIVITWSLTEPFGNLLDYGWFKTANRFQAVLHRDGSVDMSYKELAARDAIVGLFPAVSSVDKERAATEVQKAKVHFSSLTAKDGPFAIIYESFHYPALPRPQDLSCTVIQALGDKFDFLAYYSDFRVDNQEASTPSDGPLEDNIKGIGKLNQFDPRTRCTQGRFQLGFDHPVYVGANEMFEQPPEGSAAENIHDITYYRHQLAEGSPDGKGLPYNYAITHIGHEVSHRWLAYVDAKVNGATISLGPWPHWDTGLQTTVAFPYQLPTEASTMGGGVWQDNFDGTYTRLRDGYFVPAPGYSYLDLYLMGFISAAEVPDFFLLKNLVPAGKDTNAHSVYKAERMKVTIRDVIAAAGPRVPDVDHSQKKFNTGIVIVVEHGKNPSRELVERANGIRQQWIEYWTTTTGHRASMTVDPH